MDPLDAVIVNIFCNSSLKKYYVFDELLEEGGLWGWEI